MTPGTRIELVIEKPAHGGRMLARREGQVVLVSGAIPGERVLASVEREQRGVVFARVIEVRDPHPARRPDNGDPACGGMVFSHITCEHQRALKAAIVEDAFTRIGRLPLVAPVAVAESPEHGYRLRARVHVRRGRLGSFREGTHEVCDAGMTGQLLPETVDVLREIESRLRSAGVSEVSAIEIAENLDASERVVHVDDGDGAPLSAAALASLGALPGLTGLTRSGARSRRISAIVGRPWVADPVARFLEREPPADSPLLRRHAPAFFQANRYLTSALASYVTSLLRPGRIVDLYAGVGLFALCAAAAGQRDVTAVEGDPVSSGDLADNARAFPSVEVVSEPVERFLGRVGAGATSTLVVDPPRTGMSRDAMDGVTAARASRIVYVSCDVATLARDAGRLVAAGYAMTSLTAFDLFPNTPHVEAVAAFDLA